MSSYQHSYLNILAQEYNVLYITSNMNQMVSDTLGLFANKFQIDANEKMLDNLNMILAKNYINLVILDVRDISSLGVDFYKAIRKVDEKIVIALVADFTNLGSALEIIADADTLIDSGVSEDEFSKKIFNVLSPLPTMKNLFDKHLSIREKSKQNESIAEFLDTYEGSSLFISDELLDILKELDSGSLSGETLKRIAIELREVGDIFDAFDKTKSVVPIYKDLAVYLDTLETGSIKPENIKGFDYLSDILADISMYLVDMFVERIFRDVYVFKDSLKNNIDFMKTTLEGIEDDTSELDFF